MRRKVIKQGHNTLTMTIPSKWAKEQGLKSGDEISVTEQEKNLILSKEGFGNVPSTTTIDISDLSAPLIWRYISSAYRAGYDEITITGIGNHRKDVYSAFSYNTLDYLKKNVNTITSGLDMSPMETVSACVNRLIGVEIIEQKPNYCMIKDMSDVTDKEFNNALRRIFVLLQTEAESIKDGLSGNTDSLKSIHIVDTNLDRFEDFCFRVLNKKGYQSVRKTCIMHSVIFTLELLGDEFKKVAVHILEDKGNYTQVIRKMFRMQTEQMQRFYKLFYKYDRKNTMMIYDKDTEATQCEKECRRKFNDAEVEILHHLKKIGIHLLSLTELKIDLEF